ncbi:MAG: type IV secretory system conjugative DNA transfer family protein [Parvibaculum sp.]|uniref:type IV secretory system conjugative DNA transfer family protein n=1 Tax=Parvibaculum sp. TaxID=2024848 RepID=UPI00283DF66C|nr:type IV secretory system conjugative DNA transfer family protein [Parvibaculum sp.]MDR3500690.1 type IV secretory system conjugative DNA transfer family protein [Parvibaculum sp.]
MLVEKTERLWQDAPARLRDPDMLVVETGLAVFRRFGRTPGDAVVLAVADCIEWLMSLEGLDRIAVNWQVIETDIDEAIKLRRYIHRQRRWLIDFDTRFALWQETIFDAFVPFLAALPGACFEGSVEFGTFETPLIDILDEPASVIEPLLRSFFDRNAQDADLFAALRDRANDNAKRASGIDPDNKDTQYRRPLIMPTGQRGKSGQELVELYLRGTGLRALFETPIPVAMPPALRFEHCHIIGGTGHGKTQLMQRMICADLAAAMQEKRAVVVIDSQGDLINSLVRLACFTPGIPGSLADRLVLIDPEDIEYPVALNMFDAHLERTSGYRPVDRERVQNGAIELYEYFFGALLGAELTQKQGVIFKYLARLMLTIPQATIHTLMQLMEDGTKFRPYMENLPGSARHFFETEFFHPSFAATKKQILRRLWGVLATPAFERMFSHPENKVDLFEALNEGKIVLINTSKDLLKQEGSSLFGRFFIAMLTQAALERSTVPAPARTPAFFYVDEAQEYFDENIETILNQARKYRVGLTLAHQNLDQLGPRLRAAVLANTSIKCAGGVSARDAHALAPELRTGPDFIERMRKRGGQTEFAAWMKGVTGQAIKLTVPLGLLAQVPKLTEDQLEFLYVRNRERYAAPPVLPAPQDFESLPEEDRAEEAPRPVHEEPKAGPLEQQPHSAATAPGEPLPLPPSGNLHINAPRPPMPVVSDGNLGKGGAKHRYLQSMVKQLGEQHGFRATIEAPIAGNNGQIDVLLERPGLSLAFEISVTTPLEHEIENARKCLAASAGRVVIVVSRPRSLPRCKELVVSSLTPEEQNRVEVLSPDDLMSFIASHAASPEMTEGMVRGYRVVRRHTTTTPEDARERAEALAKVITRSLRKLED